MTESFEQPDAQLPARPSRWRWCLLAVPFVATLVAFLFASANTARTRLMREWTQSPWESEIVMDASRIAHHLPVYTDPAIDHATHMYGPLGTYVVVPFIKRLGADPRIPRFIAAAAALTVCLLCASMLSKRSTFFFWTWFFAFGLCWLQFYRIREWATEARPDATALLWALISLTFFYRSASAGSSRSSWIWTILGSISIVIAFFFKQPLTMVTLIPPAMLIATRSDNLPKRLLRSAVPILSVIIAIGVIRLAWPWVYYYMVKVPGKYPVSFGAWLLSGLELFRFNTLFIGSVFFWSIATIRRDQTIDPIDAWLLGTIILTGLVGSAARAKFGGYFNSLLPTYLAMSLFAARRLPDYFRAMQSRTVLSGILLSILPAILLTTDTVAAAGGRTLNPGAIALQHGDRNFATVIKLAKSLPGTFVSPDDPLIALYAKNYYGRCGECDLDAAGRDRTDFPTPDYMLAELRDADWVLQVDAARPPSIPAAELQKLGFEKTHGMIPANSVYILWKRLRSPLPPGEG